MIRFDHLVVAQGLDDVLAEVSSQLAGETPNVLGQLRTGLPLRLVVV